MALLAVKALLAPSFVVGASLTVRRFGPQVGGLVGGLPVVAGPILLVFALMEGSDFAARAAAATLLGLVSLTSFVVVYGRLASRGPWPACLLAGSLAFALLTVAFSAVEVPAGTALVVSCTGFALGLLLLPHPGPALQPPATPPAWDLPLRAGCALALVLALTTAASSLGAQLSGLLAPFPVITTVLATFTHAQHGADETVRVLRGMTKGFVAYALFCFTLASTLPTLGIAGAFALATAAALLTQALMIHRMRTAQPARAERTTAMLDPASGMLEPAAALLEPAAGER
jgi:hypothetical protein